MMGNLSVKPLSPHSLCLYGPLLPDLRPQHHHRDRRRVPGTVSWVLLSRMLGDGHTEDAVSVQGGEEEGRGGNFKKEEKKHRIGNCTQRHHLEKKFPSIFTLVHSLPWTSHLIASAQYKSLINCVKNHQNLFKIG